MQFPLTVGRIYSPGNPARWLLEVADTLGVPFEIKSQALPPPAEQSDIEPRSEREITLWGLSWCHYGRSAPLAVKVKPYGSPLANLDR